MACRITMGASASRGSHTGAFSFVPHRNPRQFLPKTYYESASSSSSASPRFSRAARAAAAPIPPPPPGPAPQLRQYHQPAADVAVPNNAPQFQRVTAPGGSAHPSYIKQVLAELKEINSAKFSDEQIEVTAMDSVDHVKVTLRPNDGLYKGGEFEFLIVINAGYPHSKPSFKCLTPIFHPNISYDGDICFSLLQDGGGDDEGERSEPLRLADFAHGLLWLLYYPNLFSRYNGDCPRDPALFASLVRKAIFGIAGKNEMGVMLRKLPRHTNSVNPQLVAEVQATLDDEKAEVAGKKDDVAWEWRLNGEEFQQVFLTE